PQRLVYRGLALVRVHVVPDLVGHRLPGLPVRLEAPGEPVPFELVLAPAPRLLDLQVDAGVSLTRVLHVHMEPVLPDLCIVDGYRGEVAGLASPVVPAGGLRAAALLLVLALRLAPAWDPTSLGGHSALGHHLPGLLLPGLASGVVCAEPLSPVAGFLLVRSRTGRVAGHKRGRPYRDYGEHQYEPQSCPHGPPVAHLAPSRGQHSSTSDSGGHGKTPATCRGPPSVVVLVAFRAGFVRVVLVDRLPLLNEPVLLLELGLCHFFRLPMKIAVPWSQVGLISMITSSAYFCGTAKPVVADFDLPLTSFPSRKGSVPSP